MFDNVGFNVAIGLVFIYLLYSLLVTTVGEYISTKLGIRARLLRIAIERMLNDGYFEKIEHKKNKHFQGWLRKNVFYEADEFKNSFAGRFYEFPAIKYLARIEDDYKGMFSSTKPSYLSADYFADSLIDFLDAKGVGTNSMEKIAFCLKYNTHHIQPKTLKQFVNLFERSENNKVTYKQNLIKWFNETMDRTTGWHKRKMRTISFYLAFIIASSFNVDSIRMAKILSNDKEARNQLVNIGIALSKDSLRYKDFIDKNDDTVHSKAIIDSGLARITKDLNEANLILGLGWHFSDSLKNETTTLDSNNNVKKPIDSLDKFIQDNEVILNGFDALFVSLSQARIRLDSLKYDVLVSREQFVMLDATSVKNKDSLKLYWNTKLTNDTNEIKRVEAEMNIIFAERVKDSAAIASNNILSRMLYTDINKLLNKKYLQIDSIGKPDEKGIRIIYGKAAYSVWDKFIFIVTHIVWFNLIGFLITAFALALGAPFWFDILNKLVSIRGVGIKPEEKKENKIDAAMNVDPALADVFNNPPLPGLNEEPIDVALRIYADQIRTEEGVVNVIRGYYKINGNTEKCLQVNVVDEITAVVIKTKYKSIRVGERELVYLNVIVTGKTKLNGGFEGPGKLAKGICNSITPGNIGSYGCLVKKKDDPQKIFLLSCYHVMNADLTWKNRTVFQDIRSQKGIISNKYEGYLTTLMDTALAEISDRQIIDRYKAGLKCRIPKSIRDISAADVFTAQAFVQGYSTPFSSGLIVNDSSPESFDYPLEAKKFFNHQFADLFIISHNESGFPNFKGTTRGDSGAIVLDEKDRALGIVVGSDLVHTYVIKIKTIFDFLGLELITA